MTCPDKLQVYIEAPQDLNFLVYVEQTNLAIGQAANTKPSPAGRTITSSTITNNDVVTITGWVRCLKCGVQTVDLNSIIPRLKYTIEAQKYTSAEFATLTVSGYVNTLYMLLRDVSIDIQGNSPQELMITMNWESANFAGGIVAPNFNIGGVQ